jgi:hypothetical protein
MSEEQEAKSNWITNAFAEEARKFMKVLDPEGKQNLFTGPPKGTSDHDVKDLQKMTFVGIYKPPPPSQG